MPPNQALFLASNEDEPSQLLSSAGEPLPTSRGGVQRVALLGTGMMGREHCSYLMGYPYDARIDFLCDPVRFFASLERMGALLLAATKGLRFSRFCHERHLT
jgi:hypothetical protein